MVSDLVAASAAERELAEYFKRQEKAGKAAAVMNGVTQQQQRPPPTATHPVNQQVRGCTGLRNAKGYSTIDTSLRLQEVVQNGRQKRANSNQHDKRTCSRSHAHIHAHQHVTLLSSCCHEDWLGVLPRSFDIFGCLCQLTFHSMGVSELASRALQRPCALV